MESCYTAQTADDSFGLSMIRPDSHAGSCSGIGGIPNRRRVGQPIGLGNPDPQAKGSGEKRGG